jgi:hypothetical protein
MNLIESTGGFNRGSLFRIQSGERSMYTTYRLFLEVNYPVRFAIQFFLGVIATDGQVNFARALWGVLLIRLIEQTLKIERDTGIISSQCLHTEMLHYYARVW